MGRLLIQFAGTNTTKALSETLPQNVIIVDEDLHQLRLHDGTTPGGHIIGGSGGGGVPVGTIIPFAGNSIPEGFLLCDGSAISRTDYATLFAVIGTIYGSGDGNSTFNLPNYTDVRIGGIPDYSRGVSYSNSTHTFSEDGFYISNTSHTQNQWPNQQLNINNNNIIRTYASTNDSAGQLSYQVLINKDFSYTFQGKGTGTFYPFVKPNIPTNFCIKY